MRPTFPAFLRMHVPRAWTGLLIACAAFGSATGSACAELPLVSPVFGDHMVLQRGKPDRIWGWAKPGTEITVRLGGKMAAGVAAPDGRWEVQIEPPAAGGPYVLEIDGPRKIEFRDVLVGDVWLCGGQSNMAFGLAQARDGAAEVGKADHPGIRFLRVEQKCAYAPADVPQGAWHVCAPEEFSRGGGLSAVAYYFGRRINAEIGIPVGLVQTCVGGSPAESWMSAEALRALPAFGKELAEIDRLKAAGGPEYGNYVMHWYDEYDRGLKDPAWDSGAFDDTSWETLSLENGFAALGVPSTPAVCWFRREIVLPDPLPGGAAKLMLGVVEKMDTARINGRWVGASSWVENPRVYPIADGVLRPGRNLIVLRVLKLKPDGGFMSPPAARRLVLGDGTAIPLEGVWKGAVSVDARPPHPLPLGYENYPIMPAVLYNAMLRPLAPLAVTGAIWYQGEANFTRAAQYRTLMPALIGDWRARFRQGDFPFYIVGLPAFMARKTAPGGDGWTALREVQAQVAGTVPNAALAVTVDTGDADNIHPVDKQPVGERLALCALKSTYGRDVVCSGPTFARMEAVPGGLRLHFTNTGGGLAVRGGRLGEFSVAGADRIWHWAEARLDGDTVVVASPKVPQPVAVRYAWQANPLATLCNGAGLPAVPFRTDDWDPSGK